MKVFLDDRRPAPDSSWTVVQTPEEAIALLETGQVEVISFDHDLGLIEDDGAERTGATSSCAESTRSSAPGSEPREKRGHEAPRPEGGGRSSRAGRAAER
jgi:hypothetical protein